MTDNEGTGIAALAARLGWDSVPEILVENEVAIRRGHHLGLVASEGSGLEALYAFAALQGSDGSAEPDPEGIRTLVLSPTDERAGRVARSLRKAGGPEGPKVFLAGGGWAESGGIPPGTRVVVSRPSRVLPAIRSGHLGIGSLELLILDGVDSLSHLDEWSSVEPVLDAIGSEVRRIAATSRSDEAFRQLLERRLPRGRRWPEELLPIAGTVPEADEAGQGPLLRVAVGPSSQRLALLEACVTAAGGPEESILVICADRTEADQTAAALSVLGREAIVDGNRIRLEGSRPESMPAARILFGVPFDLGEFREALDQADHRFVVVEQGRLAHVENLARRAGMPIAVAGGAPPGDPLDAVVIYRRRLEDAIRTTDYVPELLVLEPLIETFGGTRVAAALSFLLRRRDETRPDAADFMVPWPDIEAASLGGPMRGAPPMPDVAARTGRRPPGKGTDRGAKAIPRGARPAWTKLYFGIGKKDEIKPGDLVGAITGEAGIVGGQVGKIDIRGGFSIVEIDSQVVDDVLRRLQGVTIRGQDVPVRLDRER